MKTRENQPSHRETWRREKNALGEFFTTQRWKLVWAGGRWMELNTGISGRKSSKGLPKTWCRGRSSTTQVKTYWLYVLHVLQWKGSHYYKFMCWNNTSPDLNPMEHLWGKCMQSTHKLPLAHKDICFCDLTKWVLCIVHLWSLITESLYISSGLY